MFRVGTEPSPHGQRRLHAVSMMTDAEVGDEEMQQHQQQNWYSWSRQSATLGDHYGSESITTVYAVKSAIGQTSRKGWSLVEWLNLGANGKMRGCGDAGLQFRVSRVKV